MIAGVFNYIFSADASKLEEGEKKAEKQNEKLKKSLHETDKVSDKLGDSFKELITMGASAVAAFLTIDTFKEGIESAAEYGDTLGKTAQLIGANSNELAAYQEAVVESDGSVETFKSTITNLNANMQEFAKNGTSSILPFMQELGVSMTDTQGKTKNVLELLPELAEKAKQMGQSEFSGIASKIERRDRSVRTGRLSMLWSGGGANADFDVESNCFSRRSQRQIF